MNQPTTIFRFPILKNINIVQTLNECNIPFNLEDLQKPHPTTIRMVYETFVTLLMGITKENLQQPQFNALSQLSFPELHEEAIPELAFYRNILKLLKVAGIPDPSVKDIVFPEYKRTKTILSAIINFAKFREERLEKFNSLQEESEGLYEMKQNLEMEIQEIESQLKQIKSKRELERPQVEQLESEISEIKKEILNLNHQQGILQIDNKNIKQIINEINEKIQNKKFILMNLNQEINKLKSQVVHSPEKTRKIISDLKISLSNEKEGIIQAEKENQNFHAKLDQFCRAEKEIQKLSKLMEEFEVEMNKKKETHKKEKEIKSKLIKTENDFKELEIQEQHSRRKLKSIQEKIDNLTKEEEIKLKQAEENFQKVLKEKEELIKQRISNKSIIDQNNLTAQRLQEKIEELKKKHEEDLIQMNQRFDLLDNVLRKYYQELFKAIKSV